MNTRYSKDDLGHFVALLVAAVLVIATTLMSDFRTVVVVPQAAAVARQ